MMFGLGDKDGKRDGNFEMMIKHNLGRVGFQSSSSISSGFGSSDDGSSYSVPSGGINCQIPNSHHLNGLCLESESRDSRSLNSIFNENLVEELSLGENFCRMNIRDEQKDFRRMRGLRMGFDEIDSLSGMESYNAVNYGGFSDYGGFQSSNGGVPTYFSDDMNFGILGLPGKVRVGGGDSIGPYGLYTDSSCYKNEMGYVLDQRKEQGISPNHRGIHLQNLSWSNSPYFNDAFVCSQQCGVGSNGGSGYIDPMMNFKLGLNIDNPANNVSLLKERTRAMANRSIEGFGYEDSFILQGNVNNYVMNKGCDTSRGYKLNFGSEIGRLQNVYERSSGLDSRMSFGGIYDNDHSLSSNCPFVFPSVSSLAEIQGYIYEMAKDQNGCRFLQKIFSEGTYEDVQIIFNEIISHVVELMTNQFGNYLLQKLLDVCNEDQRTKIVLMVTREPGQLVKISLNTQGTRVVQKLIETLKTRQQISLVKLALEPGFIDLIKDLNGNHVVQRCLQCLSNEDNKFIFEAAAKSYYDIAIHRHGCCVLQRCITYSIGEQREKLVNVISTNGLRLAQDPYGNYVVQYVIQLQIPSSTANLVSQFAGNYVLLATQKFSSHVIQKCLKHFEGKNLARIIHELLSVPNFEQLLQDPYCNYVLLTALEVTEGPLRASLVEAVRPHMTLRTSPYCKRIFSCSLLKK